MNIKCPRCDSEIELSPESLFDLMNDADKQAVTSRFCSIYGKKSLGNPENQRRIANLPASKSARRGNIQKATLVHLARTLVKRLGNTPNIGDSYSTRASRVVVTETTDEGVVIALTNIRSGITTSYSIHLNG